MKIQVSAINEELEDGFNVSFLSSYGVGNATFIGNRPTLNNQYFVEIDLEGILIWGKDIVKKEDTICKIEAVGELISLHCRVEVADTDGYSIIRLGDSIIPIETEGEKYSIGSYIKTLPLKLKLHDVGL